MLEANRKRVTPNGITLPRTSYAAQVALRRCPILRMSKAGLWYHFSIMKVNILSGATCPWRRCSFSVKPVLFLRHGGAKTPCKRCWESEIYNICFLSNMGFLKRVDNSEKICSYYWLRIFQHKNCHGFLKTYYCFYMQRTLPWCKTIITQNKLTLKLVEPYT